MAVRSRARPGCAQAGCTPAGYASVLLALAGVGVALVALGSATAAAAELRCGATVAADAVLRRDLACPRSPALTVRGPAALDLGGHAVRCTDRVPAAAACIDLVGAGARLHAGAVAAHAAAAVRLAGGGGHAVRRVTAVSGADVGFEVRSDGNRLDGNTDLRSGAYGFHVAGDGNRLEGNTSSGSAGAGFAVTGAGNELRGNTAVRVEVAGTVVTGPGNRLVGNRVVGFGPGADLRSRVGVLLAAPAAATTVRGNTVVGTGTGLAVHSGGNEIGGNRLRGNRIGISVFTAAGGNTIAGNRATGNAGVDLVDGNAGCAGNSWRGNAFARQPGLYRRAPRAYRRRVRRSAARPGRPGRRRRTAGTATPVIAVSRRPPGRPGAMGERPRPAPRGGARGGRGDIGGRYPRPRPGRESPPGSTPPGLARRGRFPACSATPILPRNVHGMRTAAMMNRDMLIEAADGEAEIAAFDLDLDRGTPAGGAASPLDRAVTAGLATPCVSVFVRALALLLAAGWLAGLFRAVLPWSLTAYLAAAAVAAAVMIGRRNRRGHAHVGPRGCRWRR